MPRRDWLPQLLPPRMLPLYSDACPACNGRGCRSCQGVGKAPIRPTFPALTPRGRGQKKGAE